MSKIEERAVVATSTGREPSGDVQRPKNNATSCGIMFGVEDLPLYRGPDVRSALAEECRR
jgi:hypothetical protein